MIDLESCEYALHPLSGVAEAWHAAGVGSDVAEAGAVHGTAAEETDPD